MAIGPPNGSSDFAQKPWASGPGAFCEKTFWKMTPQHNIFSGKLKNLHVSRNLLLCLCLCIVCLFMPPPAHSPGPGRTRISDWFPGWNNRHVVKVDFLMSWKTKIRWKFDRKVSYGPYAPTGHPPGPPRLFKILICPPLRWDKKCTFVCCLTWFFTVVATDLPMLPSILFGKPRSWFSVSHVLKWIMGYVNIENRSFSSRGLGP